MQVERAKSYLQGKQKTLGDLLNVYERHRKEFAVYHTSAVNTCKLTDKHPELLGDIPTLQRQLKELGQKFVKAKGDRKVFATSHQQAKPSFFAIMHKA